MTQTSDLFSNSDDESRETGLESIQIPDADIRFMHAFYSPSQADSYFSLLMKEVPWRHDVIEVWGKQHLQPRLTAWYGDEGAQYSYSNLKLAPLAWTPTLATIKSDIEQISGATFNSVLINLYRDQEDSVGWHSDDETELGKHPVIASLSLGETRTFRMKHKTRKTEKKWAIDLSHGSLLLMAGATQQHWLHAVNKETRDKGPRINLTFRTIYPGNRE